MEGDETERRTPVQSHFVEVDKMVSTGFGAQRPATWLSL